MHWLTLASATAALLGLGLAGIGRYRLRQTRATLAETEARLQKVTKRLKSSEDSADELRGEVRRLQARLDHIALEKRRVHGDGEQTDILTAISLTRKGVDIASLAQSCRLSRGEARLIGTLYGRAEGAALEGDIP